METPSLKDKDTVIIEERITKVNGDFHIKKWARGKLLGRGGFAKVFNFTNLENGKIMAGKIMPKANLNRSRSKQKLMTEIRLHKSLTHPNIVKFEHVFEDHENVYIMLELCHNQSMSELIKRRKKLIEFEVQCYLIQLIDALKYLHANKIIHRDLKLGNMFLNDKMQVKVGDFGLAAKLEFDGEKKRTVCGTPNYIAPEIIDGNIGHSYEVDTWAVGVIIYTLIIGKPPFETTDIKLTYKKIKENDYAFPEHAAISDNAKDLIKRILVTQPEKRLTLDEILMHPFIDHGGPIPRLLPTSTLACPPTSNYLKQFASSNNSQRIRISTEPDGYDNFEMLKQPQFINTARANYAPKTPSGNEIRKIDFFAMTPKTPKLEALGSARFNPLAILTHDKAKLTLPLPLQTPTRKEFLNTENIEEVPERESSPEKIKLTKTHSENHGMITDVRVIKWYDYSSKYGLGYVLSTGAVGVSFNDGAKLIAPPGETFTYIERKPSDKTEIITNYKFKDYPSEIHKRVLVYNKFKENFDSAIKTTTPHDSSFVYVKKWLKTKHAVLFRMNNRVLQVIFNDGTVLIMNSNNKKLTFVDFKGHTHFCALEEATSSDNKDLTKRLKYAEDVLKQIWQVQTDKMDTLKTEPDSVANESNKEIHGIDLNKVIIGLPTCISPRLSTTASTKDTS